MSKKNGLLSAYIVILFLLLTNSQVPNLDEEEKFKKDEKEYSISCLRS